MSSALLRPFDMNSKKFDRKNLLASFLILNGKMNVELISIHLFGYSNIDDNLN